MGPGSHLKKMFHGMLANADKKCLCHPRAQLMDIWGVRICLQNIEGIIDWIEEEAERRGLTEDPTFREKMKAYVTRVLRSKYRILRPFPVTTQWIAMQILRRKGASRRLVIKRLVLICIERARRKKLP